MLLFPFICLLYVLLPLIGYWQFRKERSATPDAQQIPLNKKRILKANSSEPSLQLIKWGLMAAVAAVVGIVPLLGLPGALLVSIYEFLGLVPSSKLSGDKMWPIAIIFTICFPLGWPLAIAMRNALPNYTKRTMPKFVRYFLLLWFIIALIFLKYLL